ncbi:MAG TPA: tetratricopeptide repeat protein [Ktedonobacteraceae bacterium]|jgi:tetratricopeptide (TPR) repeat protein
MYNLPDEHHLRQLPEIETFYREALPVYESANRSISAAFLQRDLGNVLSDQGRYSEALELLQTAAQSLKVYEHYGEEIAWILASSANVLENLGRYEEAIASYTEALALLPDSAPLLRNRAVTLIYARKLDEAKEDLVKAVDIDGNEDSPYLWNHRAHLAVVSGDGLPAEQLLHEVLKRDVE